MADEKQLSLFPDTEPRCSHCDGTGWTKAAGVNGVVRCSCVVQRRDHLAAEGITKAVTNLDPEYREKFLETAQEFAQRGLPFTSETVIAAVGLPRGRVGSNLNNAVGALINGLGKRGVIAKVGKVKSQRPRSHGAEIWVWRGCSKAG